MCFKKLFDNFCKEEDGATNLMEFVLLSVPVVLIITCLIQYVFLAQTQIAVEHAANAAARSALVHKCRPIAPPTDSGVSFGTIADVWGSLNCNDSVVGRRAWTTAARVALMPVSSSSDDSLKRYPCTENNKAFPTAVVSFAAQSLRSKNLSQAIWNMACYAFEPNNVTVKVDWDNTALGLTAAGTVPPLTAEVTFRAPIFSIVSGIFATGRRNDGTHFRVLKAKATLL